MCREITRNSLHKDGPVLFWGFCNEFGGPYATWQGFANYLISTGFPKPPWPYDRLVGCTDVWPVREWLPRRNGYVISFMTRQFPCPGGRNESGITMAGDPTMCRWD